MADLERIILEFPFTANMVLVLPKEGATFLQSFPGFYAVNLDGFHAGFRVPLPGFVVVLLNDLGINPVQLHPNGWRAVIRFLLQCHDSRTPPTLDLFRKAWSIRRINEKSEGGSVFTEYYTMVANYTHNTPFSGKVDDWKGRWFLLHLPSGLGVRRLPRDSGAVRQLTASEKRGKAVALEAFAHSEAIDYVEFTSNRRLEAARLSRSHPRVGMSFDGHFDEFFLDCGGHYKLKAT